MLWQAVPPVASAAACGASACQMLNDRYMPVDESDDYELTREDSGRHSQKHDRKHKKSKKEKKHREASPDRHRHSEEKRQTDEPSKRSSKHAADDLEDGEIMEDGEVLDGAVQQTSERRSGSARNGLEDLADSQRRYEWVVHLAGLGNMGQGPTTAGDVGSCCSVHSAHVQNFQPKVHHCMIATFATAQSTQLCFRSLAVCACCLAACRSSAPSGDAEKQRHSSTSRPPTSRDRDPSREPSKEPAAAVESSRNRSREPPAADRSAKVRGSSRERSRDRSSSRRRREQPSQQQDDDRELIDRPSRHSSRDPRDYRSSRGAGRSDSRLQDHPDRDRVKDRDRYGRDRDRADRYDRDRLDRDRHRADAAARDERRRRSSRSRSIDRRLAAAPRSFEERQRERERSGAGPRTFEDRERERERYGNKRSRAERDRGADGKVSTVARHELSEVFATVMFVSVPTMRPGFGSAVSLVPNV